tara:strand:+ start:1556 stop:2410 length:855 start_codon:yes stop_codon:yes gene_type:complete
MSLINMGEKKRPILITGKSGTGKSTMAKAIIDNDDVLIYYANELEDRDWKSVEQDIIIEEVHYKPKKDIVMDIIRNVKGSIVLTSNNEKDVPKVIKNCCKVKRAGTKKHLIDNIKRLAPRSEEPYNINKSVFDLVGDYLKNPNRDLVLKFLKYNKPPDVQIMTWLGMNLHPNKLTFVDGVVKRRWSSDYFYELLAYSHDGRIFSRLTFPKRGSYSKIPTILRKLKIKPNQGYLINQLLMDDEFHTWASKRLKSEEKRVLGIKERARPRTAPIIPERTLKLEGWF